MNIKPIKTDVDYEAALAAIEQLINAAADTPEGDRLDVLTTLVAAWEAQHLPIDEPAPIEMIKHRMEAQGLTRQDLEPMIGSRGRVSEVLSRRRPLSLTMIRRLSQSMHIPADVLIRPYDLQGDRQP